MKVGIVCPYSLDVPGGVQHHVCELAEALIGLGARVSVLAPADAAASGGAAGGSLPPYVVPGGPTVPVPYNGSVARLAFGPGSVARVRGWLAEQDLDVLHVHEPTAPSLSLLALWAAEVPTVATFHASMPSGSRVLAVAGGVLRPALERIGARIVVSQLALETMRRHVGGSAVVIPNGLWVEPFAQAQPVPAWSGTGGTVAFLGRTDEPRKGLDVLLDAWPAVVARRPGVRLLVAGHGDPDALRERVSGQPPAVAASIDLLGPVDAAARVRLLASSDVFVAPHTRGESFGIVLVEAMAAGAAVLASDLPAFVAVLRGGRLGRLFAAGDAAALADGAVALLDDPVERGRLVRRADLAARTYDWSVVARRVLRVYETVSGAGRRTGREPPPPARGSGAVAGSAAGGTAGSPLSRGGSA